MIKSFPVTKLKDSISEKGVHIAKRDEGAKVAECKLDLQNASLSELMPEQNADQDQIVKSKKVRACLEGGLELLSKIDSGLREDITIEFLDNHAALIDVKFLPWPVIRCDIDIVDEVDSENAQGVSALYTLGLLFVFQSIQGIEEKSVLNKIITFYENLEDEGKAALTKNSF